MRKTFQIWLFIFVAIAFTITFLLSFFFQTRQAQQNAEALIRLRFQDAQKQIRINNENLDRIRQMVGEESKAKTRAFARMIMIDPTIVGNQDRLNQIAKDLQVDELHVSDSKGILVASYPCRKEYKRYDMNSADQSRVFMPAITDPKFELVQEMQKQGAGSAVVQYTGVARKDEPGIVQVAYVPKRLEEAIKLADIANLAAGFRIGSNGEMVIIKGNTIVSVQDRNLLGKNIADFGVPLRQFAKAQKSFRARIKGVPVLCLFEKIGNDTTLLGFLPENEMYVSRNSMAIELTVANLLLFVVVFVLVSSLVQRIVINGIYRVNHSLKEITDGNLDEKVNVRTNKEFNDLSHGINCTVSALKDAIAEAAARIDRELEFARAIQLSALPKIFPPFPDRKEFDIYASMFPAKEVGGDFYDLFLVDNNHLAFVIADVSGKGIPAALFMMTSKTVINNYAKTGISAAEVFTRTNEYLCANNEAGMFVTAFIGILEIDTGKLTIANAGHNPPLLRQGSQSFQWLKTKNGFVLGGMEGVQYPEAEIQLVPGDVIYLYTDGVTEALNPSSEFFGDPRLLETVNQKIEGIFSPETLIGHIKKEIALFRKDAQQSDDITMLAVQYFGKSTEQISN
ncbi:MAG: SpoIIE family protein phosphatase [Planctomycetia bacterium]|nr:SpoIIE family protein phosphatase [Planctomycetia bacterium]